MIECGQTINQTKGKSPMNSITKTIGVDLAKQVFAICEVDGTGRVRQRRDFRRCELAAWLAQLPAGTVMVMEACSGAHYWARRCLAHDLIVSVKSEARQARLSWHRVREGYKNESLAISN
jgi:transposase